jgi:hypothetical protein
MLDIPLAEIVTSMLCIDDFVPQIAYGHGPCVKSTGLDGVRRSVSIAPCILMSTLDRDELSASFFCRLTQRESSPNIHRM